MKGYCLFGNFGEVVWCWPVGHHDYWGLCMGDLETAMACRKGIEDLDLDVVLTKSCGSRARSDAILSRHGIYRRDIPWRSSRIFGAR